LEIVYSDTSDISRSAAEKRFENDMRRLRHELNCNIIYNRAEDEYELVAVGIPLLDLSNLAAQGLAFINATFSNTEVPKYEEVQALIRQIKMILPQQRLKEIGKQHLQLELDLRQRDTGEISDAVKEAVITACNEQRLLEFNYRSPARKDEEVVRHRVEPWRYYFKRGHYYVEAYSLESYSTTHGIKSSSTLIPYRLDRMTNAQVLPDRFTRQNRRLPQYELVYVLSPEIARYGVVSEVIPGSQILYNNDGSATVHALSKNLFLDLRELLHYGANCHVIGGDDAVREMKRIVKQMYETYQD
jgi:predicted DNA-binding transcriptional regulator YafY